jgi:exopolysaccharide biosynthesis polyprenyl glycosylphosphotransferase
VGATQPGRVLTKPIGDTGRLLKRAFDVVGASFGLLLLSPLFLIVAVWIKLDSRGPVLFLQERRGFNGKSFQIYKFRSMSVMEDGRSMQQAVPDDPRITTIGAVLRRTSIDELPQLMNVLLGNMSLVGPRPHAISHDAELALRFERYAQRQRIKPGITGWAQVNGFRGDTSTQEKIEGRTLHDLYYVEHWSLWFDMRILMLTFLSRKVRDNAL